MQLAVQLFFLALFVVTVAQGAPQVWLLVFAAGLLLAFFRGRFYCSWVCPMNTLLQPIARLERRIKPWRRRIPQALRQPGLFVIVLTLMVLISRVSGGVIPPLAAAVLMAVAFSLFFQERFWHRYLCPYGALLSLPGRWAVRSLRVDWDACSGCGVCQRVCPTETIFSDREGKRAIDSSHCLQCFRCHEVCPTQAIGYRSVKADAAA